MASDYVEQVQIAENGLFVLRVQQALVKAAIDVAAEQEIAPKRAYYAERVLGDPYHYARLMAFGVATNAIIGLTSSDSDIQFTVNSLFNAYAGNVDVLQPAASIMPMMPMSSPEPEAKAKAATSAPAGEAKKSLWNKGWWVK